MEYADGIPDVVYMGYVGYDSSPGFQVYMHCAGGKTELVFVLLWIIAHSRSYLLFFLLKSSRLSGWALPGFCLGSFFSVIINTFTSRQLG